MKADYITAVLEAFKEGAEPKEVLTGLKKTLNRKGHQALYGSILRGVKRVLETGNTVAASVVVVSEAAYKAQKTAITSALKELGSEEAPTVIIDQTIIGGFVAEANNTRLDTSHKSKLIALYRSLTR